MSPWTAGLVSNPTVTVADLKDNRSAGSRQADNTTTAGRGLVLVLNADTYEEERAMEAP